MHLVGVADEERHAHTVGFWRDVYGYKMSCMKKPGKEITLILGTFLYYEKSFLVLSEASVEVVPASKVATSSAVIADLDLETCGVNDTEFTSEFEVKVKEEERKKEQIEITAVAGYFDTFFELEEEKVKIEIKFKTCFFLLQSNLITFSIVFNK